MRNIYIKIAKRKKNMKFLFLSKSCSCFGFASANIEAIYSRLQANWSKTLSSILLVLTLNFIHFTFKIRKSIQFVYILATWHKCITFWIHDTIWKDIKVFKLNGKLDRKNYRNFIVFYQTLHAFYKFEYFIYATQKYFFIKKVDGPLQWKIFAQIVANTRAKFS